MHIQNVVKVQEIDQPMDSLSPKSSDTMTDAQADHFIQEMSPKSVNALYSRMVMTQHDAGTMEENLDDDDEREQEHDADNNHHSTKVDLYL